LAYILQANEKEREKAVSHFKDAITYFTQTESSELFWVYHRDLMQLLKVMRKGIDLESYARIR